VHRAAFQSRRLLSGDDNEKKTKTFANFWSEAAEKAKESALNETVQAFREKMLAKLLGGAKKRSAEEEEDARVLNQFAERTSNDTTTAPPASGSGSGSAGWLIVILIFAAIAAIIFACVYCRMRDKSKEQRKTEQTAASQRAEAKSQQQFAAAITPQLPDEVLRRVRATSSDKTTTAIEMM
jgi:hypothetical protein